MIFRVLTSLVVALTAALVHAEPVMISVKLAKTRASRCTSPPRLELPQNAAAWRVTDKPYHNGENDWEIYFNLETEAPGPPPAEALIVAQGVSIRRAIVGKTDVPFEQQGDRIRVHLVNDQSRGQGMEVRHQVPHGGYPIYFIHNWQMRRAGKYAEGPYPAKQIAALKNYLVAAHEVLHLMGDMGPNPPMPFAGEIVLMDSEIAATRGHLDYPAHLHIMYYEFKSKEGGGRDWVVRQVPHIYMDDEGRLVKNSYAVLAGQGKSADLGIGEVCRLQDSTGRPVLDLVLTAQGLDLRRPDGQVYSLRPDPAKGAAHAVFGYRGGEPICRAEAHDDPEHGVLTYKIERIEDRKIKESFTYGYRYDPFTAHVKGEITK